MDSHTYVLSLIENNMGHATYGNFMREYFSKSLSSKVDFYWANEEREIPTRILVKLLSFSFPNQWIVKQNLDFNRFRLQIASAYIARQLAYRKLSQEKYSALHFHTQLLAFLSVDLLRKIPTIVSIDMTNFQASQENTNPKFRWTYNPNIILEKRVFEAAARVITTTEWARRSVIENYNIDENKVKVIYPGINIVKFEPPDRSKRDPKARYNILFMGGDFKRKGGEDVLEVFLTKFSEVANLHLVTYAPIECKHPNVYIYKNIKAYTPEFLELYYQADAFVMPTYADAYGTVFLEAMAAGLPVIATRLGPIREIVSHGETGFLIEPGDRHELACRIRDLIENPNLNREMGAKGRLVAERKFNAKTNFQTLESLFKEISVSEKLAL
jgi:glycosyltransferase involved in cell wall biosynthesis